MFKVYKCNNLRVSYQINPSPGVAILVSEPAWAIKTVKKKIRPFQMTPGALGVRCEE